MNKVTNRDGIEFDVDALVTDVNGKADADLLNINTSCLPIDGAWVKGSITLASGVALPTEANINYDLSTEETLFLPDDGYNYELLVTGNVTTGATSGNVSRLYLSSSISSSVWLTAAQARSAATVTVGGCSTIMVGSNHRLTVPYYSSNTGTFNLTIRAYRRVGTNR